MNEKKFDGISTRDLAAEAMIAMDDVYKSITKLNKKVEEVSERVDDIEADLLDVRESAEYAESEVDNLEDILIHDCPCFEDDCDDEDDDCDDEDEEDRVLTYDEFKDYLKDFFESIGIKNIKVVNDELRIPYSDNYKSYIEECMNDDDDCEDDCDCECGCCCHCCCEDDDPYDEIQAICDEEDINYDVIDDGFGRALVIPFDDDFDLNLCVKTYKTYKAIKGKGIEFIDTVRKVLRESDSFK